MAVKIIIEKIIIKIKSHRNSDSFKIKKEWCSIIFAPNNLRNPLSIALFFSF